MGKREEALKREIEKKYGSIPKFIEKTDVAKSTIYNVFDRGIENTRTATIERIRSFLDDSGEVEKVDITEDESELLSTYRRLNEMDKAVVLRIARCFVGMGVDA